MEPWVPERRPQDVVLDVVQAQAKASHHVRFAGEDVLDVADALDLVVPVLRDPIENGLDGTGVVGVDEKRLELGTGKGYEIGVRERVQVAREGALLLLETRVVEPATVLQRVLREDLVPGTVVERGRPLANSTLEDGREIALDGLGGRGPAGSKDEERAGEPFHRCYSSRNRCWASRSRFF
jgi:hypothetical protein